MQARVKTAIHEEGDMWREDKNVFIFSSFFIFRFSPKQRFSRLLMYFTCSTIPEENLGLLIVYGMKNLRINEEELAGA